MNDKQKTLVINTMSEEKYLELSAAGKISNAQLNIVDNDNANRTVIASYDILNQKLQDSQLSLSYDTIDDVKYIRLIDKDGNEKSRIDATEFLKDGVLNSIEYITTEDGGGLQFTIKKDDQEIPIPTIFVDSEILSVSTNAIQNKAVYEGITSTLADANSYTDSEIEKLSVDTIYQKKIDSETSAASFDDRISNIEQDYLKDEDKTELDGKIEQKAGDLSAYAEFVADKALSDANEYSISCINELTAEKTGSASQTTTKIWQTKGIINAEFADISVEQTQVNGLTSELDNLNNKFNDYYLKSETSSNGELETEFNNLNNKFNDYYLKSETSSNGELETEFKKYQLSGNYLSAEVFETRISNYLSVEVFETRISDYALSSDVSSKTELLQKFNSIDASLQTKAEAEDLQISVDQLTSQILGKTVSISDETTTDGYLKSYTIFQGETRIGIIDIPKDFLVKSGEVKTCNEENVPVSGYIVGDKYLDFIVNVQSGSAEDQHIYINVKDLTDVYTGTDGAEISVNVDSGNHIEAVIKSKAVNKDKIADSVYNEISAIASNYATSCVNGLSIDGINGSASQTVSKITESGGLISAEFTDIQINQNQVSGLIDELATINGKFSSYALTSDVSSKIELSNEFAKCQPSGDYLSTAVFNEICADHETRVLSLETKLPEIVSNIWSALSTYTEKDGQIKAADQLSVDDVMNAFHDLAMNISSLWQSMN